jgi:hypothetical protein
MQYLDGTSNSHMETGPVYRPQRKQKERSFAFFFFFFFWGSIKETVIQPFYQGYYIIIITFLKIKF